MTTSVTCVHCLCLGYSPVLPSHPYGLFTAVLPLVLTLNPACPRPSPARHPSLAPFCLQEKSLHLSRCSKTFAIAPACPITSSPLSSFYAPFSLVPVTVYSSLAPGPWFTLCFLTGEPGSGGHTTRLLQSGHSVSLTTMIDWFWGGHRTRPCPLRVEPETFAGALEKEQLLCLRSG